MTIRYKPDGSVAQKSKPREVREFNGVSYIMEEAIRGDYALIKAYKADKHGNVVFRLAANNFNGAMARNAKVTIVEAEHIVEPGELDPATIHVPGIYVDRVVQSTERKQIEKYTFAKDPEDQLKSESDGAGDAMAKREKIVKRAAKEFKDGMYANLGIGMPMLAPNFIPPGTSVTLQSGKPLS
jgi:3-oxoacid CoA-transferase